MCFFPQFFFFFTSSWLLKLLLYVCFNIVSFCYYIFVNFILVFSLFIILFFPYFRCFFFFFFFFFFLVFFFFFRICTKIPNYFPSALMRFKCTLFVSKCRPCSVIYVDLITSIRSHVDSRFFFLFFLCEGAEDYSIIPPKQFPWRLVLGC